MADTTLIGGVDTSLETDGNWDNGAPTVVNGKRAVIPEGCWYEFTSGGATWASALVSELDNPPDLANVTVNGQVTLAGTLKYATVANGGSVVGYGVIYGGSMAGATVLASGGPLLLINNAYVPATVQAAQGGSVEVDVSLGQNITVAPQAVTVPSPSNVRSGTSYSGGPGTCAVPAASNVKAGVAVDNTVGTLAASGGMPAVM